MSELHCPNCGHHIGTLKPKPPAAEPNRVRSRATEAGGRVAAWLESNGWWPGVMFPADIHTAYVAITGDTKTDQYTLSIELMRLGARYKKTAGGRVYFAPDEESPGALAQAQAAHEWTESAYPGVRERYLNGG